MAEFSELWAIGMLLAAFAGGAFGGAVGPLPAFIFTGFMVMAGETASILNTGLMDLFVIGEEIEGAGNITSSIAFGPVFGPHISFAAGTAATAFSAKRGYLDTNFPYHEAKNIAEALGPRPDVMFIGGIFGILGYWITTLSSTLNMPWDPIAVAVVLSAVAHRVFLGFPLIGDHREGLLNMEPFDREERRVIGEPAAGEGNGKNRFLVEPWLPHQYRWSHVSMLGAVVGILAAFITIETGSVFLPFGISAATLLFLNCGVSNVPVTHHISLIGSTAVMAFTASEPGTYPLYQLLLLGGLFGIISAVVGEWIQRIFYAHADTHLDPPAAAIVIGTFLVVLLAVAGIFPTSAWVPNPF